MFKYRCDAVINAALYVLVLILNHWYSERANDDSPVRPLQVEGYVNIDIWSYSVPFELGHQKLTN
jgi:hypothetical protein